MLCLRRIHRQRNSQLLESRGINCMPGHSLNWYFGWCLLLSAFVTGAILGLFFDQDAFLGGYSSFRRRLIRLGHIAQAALGMVNVLFGLSPWPSSGWYAESASLCFITGGL